MKTHKENLPLMSLLCISPNEIGCLVLVLWQLSKGGKFLTVVIDNDCIIPCHKELKTSAVLVER